MISMYILPDHTNWDIILPFVTYAYNTSTQSTTGYSLFALHTEENLHTRLIPCSLPHPRRNMRPPWTTISHVQKPLVTSPKFGPQKISNNANCATTLCTTLPYSTLETLF
ncbi:unnamed protein product [Ixodes hexagonus]